VEIAPLSFQVLPHFGELLPMAPFMLSMSRAALLLPVVCVCPASASSFLSRAQGEDTAAIDTELQSTIMSNIEDMLGREDAVTEGRLTRIVDALSVTFKAMPKNMDGKLEHAAVRYALHGYFVQRHGWYVRGLSDVGEGFNGTSSGGVLQDRVEEFVQGVFEQKLGAHGLDLREMALLAATFENLVHIETVQRLSGAVDALNLAGATEFHLSQVDDVIDAYMMSYILRFNYSSRPGSLPLVRSRIQTIYPAWPETQQFLRDVRTQHSHHKNYFSRDDVEKIVEQIGDQYGHFQDKECHALKSNLLALEDTTIGRNGSGRVRIADFYGSALTDGNWQFVETTEYLEQLGALDTQDPNIPRVVIPNYINSPSNCVAGSKYYSVCCINECEDLVDNLEHRFQKPAVAPKDISEAVASLSSSTVASGRELHPLLIARLEEIARHHGGLVPLHGRLFAQWMHHAYPRECPYPHVSGTVRAQRTEDFQKQSQKAPALAMEQIPDMVEKHRADQAESTLESSDECTAWTDHEELYVHGSALKAEGSFRRARPFVYLAALAAVASALVRQASGSKAVGFASGAGGKDFFV